MLLRTVIAVCALALCASALIGCGASAKLVPVEGRLTLNGQPLSGANVVFAKTRVSSPGPFTGKTDADGRYKLGPPDQPGEVRRARRLSVEHYDCHDPRAGRCDSSAEHAQGSLAAHRDGSTRTTVPEGGKKDVNFDMKSR